MEAKYLIRGAITECLALRSCLITGHKKTPLLDTKECKEPEYIHVEVDEINKDIFCLIYCHVRILKKEIQYRYEGELIYLLAEVIPFEIQQE